jgi:hypothetical protein
MSVRRIDKAPELILPGLPWISRLIQLRRGILAL